jgi:hypothetical protein
LNAIRTTSPAAMSIAYHRFSLTAYAIAACFNGLNLSFGESLLSLSKQIIAWEIKAIATRKFLIFVYIT